MADLAELLAVIGDYEMQRRLMIESNERLSTLIRSLIAGDVLPENVNPETFEITRNGNGATA